MSNPRKTKALVGGAAVVALVLVVVLVFARRSSSNADPSASGAASGAPASSATSLPSGPSGASLPASPTSSNPASGAAPTPVGPPGPASTAPGAPGGQDGPNTPPREGAGGVDALPAAEVPLDVNVSPTSGLANGQAVNLKITAKNGALFYGIEARLCRSGVDIQLDAAFRPSQGGNCTPEPLAAGSEAYQITPVPPPHQSADFTFKVGTGTRSWQTQYGEQASLTCGSGSPCQLVLKLQFSNGFGFQGYPLTFA